MPFSHNTGHALIAAPDNTPLRVRHIAFEIVRQFCADRGVREGDRIVRVGSTREHVLVELATRKRVPLEWELGTFIEVESVAGSSPA